MCHQLTFRVFLDSSWLDLAATWAVGYTGVQLAVEVNNFILNRKLKKLMKMKKQ